MTDRHIDRSSDRLPEVLDMEELGMEAVWKIEVEKFPAFIIIDDKGNDFFKQFSIDNVEVHSYAPFLIASDSYGLLNLI